MDPLHHWLAIPPQDQPPNFYRILGLETFEANADVISDAAERQIEYVRRYEKGDTANDARQVLKELDRAKRCLLNSRQKHKYDQQLGRGDDAKQRRSITKPDEFDPYYCWLGIPPDQQPPSRYRLLGIVPGETSPTVIHEAAERQMAHIRRKAIGQRGAFSEVILGELAAARVCLLDAKKRAAYDRQLQPLEARQPAITRQPETGEKPVTPPKKPAILQAKALESDVSRRPAVRLPPGRAEATRLAPRVATPAQKKVVGLSPWEVAQRRRKQTNRLVAAILAGALGAGAAATLLAVLFASGGNEAPVDSSRQVARDTTGALVAENSTHPNDLSAEKSGAETNKSTGEDAQRGVNETAANKLPRPGVTSSNDTPGESQPLHRPDNGPKVGDREVATPALTESQEMLSIKVVGTIRTQESVDDLAFSPAGDQLAIGCQGSLQTVQMPGGEPLLQLKTGASAVRGLVFSDDGTEVIAALLDQNRVSVWNPGKNFTKHLTYAGMRDLSAIPGTNRLLILGEPNYLAVLDTKADRQKDRVEINIPPNLQGTSGMLATSADGKRAAAACGASTIMVFNLDTLNVLAQFSAQGDHVSGLAISPDGRSIVTASNDGKVRKFNASTGNIEQILTDHFRRPANLCYAPNGKFIVVTGELKSNKNLSVQLITTDTAELAATVTFQNLPATLEEPICISPDGRYLAVGGNDDQGGVVYVLSLGLQGEAVAATLTPTPPPVITPEPDRREPQWPRLGRKIYSHEANKLIFSLAFASDSNELAAGNSGAVDLIDPRRKVVREMKGNFGAVWDLEYHGDGKRIVVLTGEAGRGKDDRTQVRFLELESGKFHDHLSSKDVERTLDTPIEMRNLSLLTGTDKGWLATNSRAPVIVDLSTSDISAAAMLPAVDRRVSKIAFAPDSGTFAVGDSHGAIYLYSATQGRIVSQPYSHSSKIHALDYAPEGKTLFSCGGDIHAWDMVAQKPKFHLDFADIDGVHFVRMSVSPDGRLLAVGGSARGGAIANIYNARSGEFITTRKVGEVGSSISAFAFSPDSKLFALAYGRTVEVWEIE